MSEFDSFWTFQIPGSEAILAAHPGLEGLLILNETAAWIWKHTGEPQIAAEFALCYGLEDAQAENIVRQTIDGWLLQLESSRTETQNLPPRLSDAPIHSREHYKVGSIIVDMRFHSPALADEIQPRLAALQVTAGSASHVIDLVQQDDRSSLFVDGAWIGSEPLVAGARILLLQELARIAEPHRDFQAILHAAAVGDTGKCIILAGQSFSGKSTLSAALMQTGLVCYSDDSAALTQDYQVAGLPFAISLREGSWFLFPHLDKPRFIPSNLNGASPTASPAAIVFVNYDPHTPSTVLRKIDTYQALLELQQSGFWIKPTQPLIAKFLDWLGALPIYRLTYAELPSAISEVRRLLAA